MTDEEWWAEQDAEAEWRDACMFGYGMAFTEQGYELVWGDDGKLHLVEVSCDR